VTAAAPSPALVTRISDLQGLLRGMAGAFRSVAFANSLGAEDMVITHALAEAGLPVRQFMLETGRLPAETLALAGEVKRRYGIVIDLVRPEAAAAADYVSRHGRDAFYDSVELRKACCRIRKVEPLARALRGHDAWITGQRRAQSVTRAALNLREDDATHGIAKFNPLVDWSEQEVWDYLRAHHVPWNALHDRGYPSIGCEPCTRAVRPGEDVRAGRWWWENADTRECGLHVAPDGSLKPARTGDVLEH
jgi:phosphoadenosine phosphosulfate reductase